MGMQGPENMIRSCSWCGVDRLFKTSAAELCCLFCSCLLSPHSFSCRRREGPVYYTSPPPAGSPLATGRARRIGLIMHWAARTRGAGRGNLRATADECTNGAQMKHASRVVKTRRYGLFCRHGVASRICLTVHRHRRSRRGRSAEGWPARRWDVVAHGGLLFQARPKHTSGAESTPSRPGADDNRTADRAAWEHWTGSETKH